MQQSRNLTHCWIYPIYCRPVSDLFLLKGSEMWQEKPVRRADRVHYTHFSGDAHEHLCVWPKLMVRDGHLGEIGPESHRDTFHQLFRPVIRALFSWAPESKCSILNGTSGTTSLFFIYCQHALVFALLLAKL